MKPDEVVTTPTNPSTTPWRGKTVLITGGTSGTGFNAARRFLTGGANVVVNGRSRERGEEALASLREISPQVSLSLGDCCEYATATRIVSETADRHGGIDTVVSAGADGEGDPKRFADMSPDEIATGLSSRFLARMYPVHAALPHLRKRPGSSIVLLTTDAARHATSGESIIGAYAAGIIQITKTLARELARDGVRVNAVSMTLTSETRSWNKIFDTESFQNDLFGKAVSRFPFGAPPTADDVADTVTYLASPGAAQITGQTISVNGGLSFGGW